MSKADGAFLTIGELAKELNLPQHILRYWESRFPQLKPLQRSGNRRYYRPADVEIARQIHHLLSVSACCVHEQSCLGIVENWRTCKRTYFAAAYISLLGKPLSAIEAFAALRQSTLLSPSGC